MTRRESKAITKEVYNKHFGKKAPKKDEVAAVVTAKAIEKGPKGPSVVELKLQAKTAGIKNFQLLHRDELIKVLDAETTQQERTVIVGMAIVRWHKGWGKRSNENIHAIKDAVAS